jgi:indoleamine 2,3-dioxygenase
MFPDGLIYEGVSTEPNFIRGPSAALDLMMPTLDRLFSLQD